MGEPTDGCQYESAVINSRRPDSRLAPLTPTIDHLFDKGFISFEDKGDLIVSPVADRPSLLKMGIKPEGKLNVGVFSEGQRGFWSTTGRMC